MPFLNAFLMKKSLGPLICTPSTSHVRESEFHLRFVFTVFLVDGWGCCCWFFLMTLKFKPFLIGLCFIFICVDTEAGVGTAPGVYLREDPICGTQLENQSELRAPTADRAAYYLDAALAARAQG